jgi:hypothetical protein
MEFEALLFGIEPLAALAVGIGAIVFIPIVEALGSAIGTDSHKWGESLSESARKVTKDSLVWGLETVDNAQSTFAEIEESFQDLLAEARAEHTLKKSGSEKAEPRAIEVVAE